MQAFGQYEQDGTASALKTRDYKDATDLVIGPSEAVGFRQAFSGDDRAHADATPALRSGPHAGNGAAVAAFRYVNDVAGIVETGQAATVRAESGTDPRTVPAIVVADPAEPLNSGGAGGGFRTEPGAHLVLGIVPIDTRNALRTTDPSEMNRQGLGLGEPGDPSHTLTEVFVPGVMGELQEYLPKHLPEVYSTGGVEAYAAAVEGLSLPQLRRFNVLLKAAGNGGALPPEHIHELAETARMLA